MLINRSRRNERFHRRLDALVEARDVGAVGIDAVQNSRAMNAWCSLNRPVSASVRAGIFERIRRWARSANVAGSRWPAISVSGIARPETR